MRNENKKKKEGEKIKSNKENYKNRRWDAVVVGIGMSTGICYSTYETNRVLAL